MRLLIICLFCLACLPLAAQSTNFKGNTHKLGLEISGGVNYAIIRNPKPDRITYSGLQLLPGYRVGITGTQHLGYSRTKLLLGFDLLKDRTVLQNYTKTSVDNFFPVAGTSRVRAGELMIDETHLRGNLGVRIDWEKVAMISSFSVSGVVSGSQVFDFVQTTTAVSDPFTGITIQLDEPLVSSGSIAYPESELRQNTYGALLLAGGYRVSDRFTILLELELGVQLCSGFSPDREYKQRNARLGLVAGYRIFGQL